jgi:hypothetical protein
MLSKCQHGKSPHRAEVVAAQARNFRDSRHAAGSAKLESHGEAALQQPHSRLPVPNRTNFSSSPNAVRLVPAQPRRRKPIGRQKQVLVETCSNPIAGLRGAGHAEKAEPNHPLLWLLRASGHFGKDAEALLSVASPGFLPAVSPPPSRSAKLRGCGEGFWMGWAVRCVLGFW